MTWSLSVSRLKIQFHLRLQVWHAVAMARPLVSSNYHCGSPLLKEEQEAFGLKIPCQIYIEYSKKTKYIEIIRNISKC